MPGHPRLGLLKPDLVQYKIERNERRGDKMLNMHNANTLLKVSLTRRKKSLWKNRLTILLSCFDFMSYQSLYCAHSAQHPLPVGPFIPFNLLTSTPFFELLCKAMSFQNISYLMAKTLLGLCQGWVREGQHFPFKETTGNSNSFFPSPFLSLQFLVSCLYRLEFGGAVVKTKLLYDLVRWLS